VSLGLRVSVGLQVVHDLSVNIHDLVDRDLGGLRPRLT
jgi:hypothetical protein